MPTMGSRHFRFLDLLKAVAANLIVLHHLAYYGPMIDYVRPNMPDMVEWLEAHARIAVHAFLAMGGFLAAKSLAPGGLPDLKQPVSTLIHRFLKLVPPFMAAMVLAVAASALASQWMTHDSISAAPTMAQLAAHALLLHSVLGYESLSAGAWYVAIDFQLYALMVALLLISAWITGPARPAWLVPLLVAAGAAASLFYFNREPDWDVWAPYFFGSYGLGALAWWASDKERGALWTAALAGAILLLGGMALEVEFRSRIAVALAVAIALVAACRWGWKLPGQDSALAGFLGRISYSLFLVHFPVCLVVNAFFTRFMPETAWAQGSGVVLAWLGSIAVGALFHRHVEVPLGRVFSAPRRSADKHTLSAPGQDTTPAK